MSLFGKPVESKSPATSAAPRPTTMAPAIPSSGQSARSSASSSACVVGAKTTVKGDLLGDEDVVIDGHVEGQIHISRDLRIGQSGSVKATVEAQSVVISGELIGDCTATNRIEIQASGKLTGNIRAPKIVIAEGAVFRGNSEMSTRRSS
ncbi:MAG: polymer-forming cytoskeletal protein [Vicinamibacteria bacterium]|nr:polymer-forming cytoskeletal protein [Vicinamibacteria bacterium]